MSATFARSRGMEAPMVGIEFTNRSNTIPAWRVNPQEKENANNPHLKRSHDAALPPPAPFDPKKNAQDIPQPVFGENLRYLFRPPSLSQPSPNAWGSGPSQEIPEVDMKDIELSPPRPPARQSFGQSSSEAAEHTESRIPREENESPERRLISNAAVRRIARRRQNPRSGTRMNRLGLRGKSKATDIDEEGGSTDEEDEDEDDDAGSLRVGRTVTRNTSNHYTLNMPGPAPAKTDTPYILLGYLQFMFNLSLVLLFLYLLVQFIFTVQHDVEQRIGEYSAEILQEITTCAHLYKQNLCETSPIPAMLHQCATWETCMSRDPKVVGRAKVGAEMLAEVVNGFVEPISWKTLLFTLSSLAFMTVFVNGLVMLYRSRLHPDRHPASAPASAPAPIPSIPPPPPPSSSSSSHTPMQIPHFPPFQSGYGYFPPTQQPHIPWNPPPPPPPAAAAAASERDTDGLPRQRRRLENGTGGTSGASVKKS